MNTNITPKRYKISTAKSRMAKVWRTEERTWIELRNLFATPVITKETAAEYAAMDKAQRGAIKDVGGFVSGELRDGVRRKGMLRSRTLIALDFDRFSLLQLEQVKKTFNGKQWVVHSTHSHTQSQWRVRLVFPLLRDCSADEAEAVGRQVAQEIGTDGIDRTTFEAERLMYWPSRSSDGVYLFEEGKIDGEPVDPDEWLARYSDWGDMTTWPAMPGDPDPDAVKPKKGETDYQAWAAQMSRYTGKSLEDPTQKEGLIGAWCRAHPMRELLDAELSDIYKHAGKDRYTYLHGSSAKGAIVYGDRWLWSNHSTDPAGGHCCNAWDLFRIHRFGHLDVTGKRGNKLPSERAMEEHARRDTATAKLMRDEAAAKAMKIFEEHEVAVDEGGDPDAWLSLLERERTGKVKNALTNYEIIILHDPELKGKLQYNLFNGQIEINGELPWTAHQKNFNDRDTANLMSYISRRYDGITHKGHLDTALVSGLNENAYHPVKKYFDSLTWDGEKRLEHLIVKVLGAEDNEINRMLTQMVFVGAVARILDPGCKFDLCLILYGPEGCGKSTLFSVMGGEWFTDSIKDFDSKDAYETIQGVMIVELAELSVMDRSSTERIKQVITSKVDKFRPSYGRITEERPRQCIFVGTTNQEKCLRGYTGNRRFPVVEIAPELRDPEMPWVREYVEEHRDQLWAEAVELYRKGFPLYFSPEMDAAIRKRSERHNFDYDNPDYDVLNEFLERRLPHNWEEYSLTKRREWLSGDDRLQAIGNVERTKVCMKEILHEQFGMTPKDASYRNKSRDLARYMDSLEGWEKQSTIRFGGYVGTQRGWKKKGSPEEDDETTKSALNDL